MCLCLCVVYVCSVHASVLCVFFFVFSVFSLVLSWCVCVVYMVVLICVCIVVCVVYISDAHECDVRESLLYMSVSCLLLLCMPS